jgi:hypothetical protein
MTAAEARGLISPFVGPEGWLPIALWRIAQDPLAGRIGPAERETVARAARAAGATTAAALRQSTAVSAEAALSASGVVIEESRADPAWGPFVHHALYSAPPPRVTLYLAALDAAGALLGGAGIARVGDASPREVVLAHEWFHHLAWGGQVGAAARPRVTTMRLGLFERHAVLRAAEEVAAAGFAQSWCGLEWPPEVLDCLTLLAVDERRGQALIRSLAGPVPDRERSMATQIGPVPR